jgi:hypothetical protein
MSSSHVVALGDINIVLLHLRYVGMAVHLRELQELDKALLIKVQL